MDYKNIIIFILIFIVLMTIFYFIISNFGISNTSYNSPSNINELEQKVSSLNAELTNIKINQIVPLPTETESIKEIIIETDQPIINTTSNSSNPSNPSNSSNSSNSNLILPSQSQPANKPPPIIYDPIANYDIAKLTDPLVDPRGRTSADQIPTPQVAMQFNFPTQGVLDRYHRVGLLIALGSNKHNGDKPGRSRSPNLDYSTEIETGAVWEARIPNKSRHKKARRYIAPDSSSETKSYRGIEIKEGFDSDDDYYSDSDDLESIENFVSSSNSSSGKLNKTFNVYNNYSNQNDNSILELIGKKITDNWYKYFTSITMGNKIIKVVIRNNNRRELYSGDIVFVPEIGKSYRVKIDPMDMIEYNPYMF